MEKRPACLYNELVSCLVMYKYLISLRCTRMVVLSWSQNSFTFSYTQYTSWSSSISDIYLDTPKTTRELLRLSGRDGM